jgi:hypothetical protein
VNHDRRVGTLKNPLARGRWSESGANTQEVNGNVQTEGLRGLIVSGGTKPPTDKAGYKYTGPFPGSRGRGGHSGEVGAGTKERAT